MPKLSPIPLRDDLVTLVTGAATSPALGSEVHQPMMGEPDRNGRIPAPEPPKKISWPWIKWLNSLSQAVNASGQQVGSVALMTQTAAIAATAIPAPALMTGRYRINTYLRVTTPATTSSSAQVTFTWVDGGVTCTVTLAAVTGNTTASEQSDVRIIETDADTVVTYAVAYASTGATPMAYKVSVSLDALPAA